MLSLFSKKSAIKDFSFLGVDMHSHLIPAVDDGAPNLETALTLIKGLADLGYKKLITTPHVYFEYYPNTTEELQAGYEQLRKGLAKENIDIEVEVAAEYFLDDHFKERLSNKDLLTFGKQYLLVEMSFFGSPPDLHQVLFNIQTKGYKPIMAHPERYGYLSGKQLKEFSKLKERGCLLQVNLLSLAGAYGKEVQKIALQLVKAGLVDLFGTDLHNQDHLRYLKSLLKEKRLMKLIEQAKVQNHLLLE